MKILFALSGFHRVRRGAEVALESIATHLARAGDEVTVAGSGPPSDTPYDYLQIPIIERQRFERWPSLPMFRDETAWEDSSFAFGLLRRFRPADYDVTITCAFPFTHLALRRPSLGRRPRHVFVTQNGDWPARSNQAEYRLFDCDGLVCINPEYFDANRDRYRCALIGNGVDTARFTPGKGARAALGLPEGGKIVLMVSALIESKNVAEGIMAVAALPQATLVIAGDGPLRRDLDQLAAEHLPGRYVRLSVAGEQMPALYRSADVFLHLSRNESFGNVFAEAMACGLPIVADDNRRSRWIMGDDAHLIDTKDHSSVVAALNRALESSVAQKERLVRRSIHFDWANIATSYREFLSEIVSGNSAPTASTN